MTLDYGHQLSTGHPHHKNKQTTKTNVTAETRGFNAYLDKFGLALGDYTELFNSVLSLPMTLNSPY